MIVAASFAFSQVADAQLGGMLNRARSAIKEAASTPSTPKVKLAIPKAVSGGQTAVFKRGEKEVAKWNPATLELTMTADGAVYKLDPKTGNFTDASGASTQAPPSTASTPFVGAVPTYSPCFHTWMFVLARLPHRFSVPLSSTVAPKYVFVPHSVVSPPCR